MEENYLDDIECMAMEPIRSKLDKEVIEVNLL
jgi:hypothetical protein